MKETIYVFLCSVFGAIGALVVLSVAIFLPYMTCKSDSLIGMLVIKTFFSSVCGA